MCIHYLYFIVRSFNFLRLQIDWASSSYLLNLPTRQPCPSFLHKGSGNYVLVSSCFLFVCVVFCVCCCRSFFVCLFFICFLYLFIYFLFLCLFTSYILLFFLKRTHTAHTLIFHRKNKHTMLSLSY